MDLVKDKNLVWLIEVNDQNYRKALQSLKILSSTEFSNWSSFKFEKDKASYLISHVALRNILSEHIKIAPQKIHFSFTKHGKPFLAYFLDVHFNLSHSHKKIFIATSKNKIGIDIEYIDTKIDYLNIVEKFFSAEERNLISNQQDSLIKRQTFFKLWTQKEAFLKALGVGLCANIKSINFKFEHSSWQLQSLEINNNDYVGSIVYKSRRAVKLDYNIWSAF